MSEMMEIFPTRKLTNVIYPNGYTRVGFFYYAVTKFEYESGPYITVTKKLGFFSYHFIKWIHGIEKLKDMAIAK